MHKAIKALRDRQKQQQQQYRQFLSPSLSSSASENHNNSSGFVSGTDSEDDLGLSPRTVTDSIHGSSSCDFNCEQSFANDCFNVGLNHSSSRYICKKRRKVIAREGSMSVVLLRNTKLSKSWTLSLRGDGGMVIETFVNKYSDLLPHLHAMATIFKSHTSVPYTFSAYSTFDALLRAFNTMILNKYGKTMCRSLINGMRMKAVGRAKIPTASPSKPSDIMKHNNEDGDENSSSCIGFEKTTALSLETIAFQLMDVYINCIYYHHFAIHIPTFNALFVDTYKHITQSPAVMALCASICVLPCHHVAHILPPGTYHLYGHHFYTLARECIADQFDSVCLETFATYVFLSVYEMGIHNSAPSSSKWHYTQLARRMAGIMQPTYVDVQPDIAGLDGEVILLQRLHSFLQRMRTYELSVEFDSNDRNLRETGYARFYGICMDPVNDVWVRAPGDTDLGNKLIEMQRYLQILRKEIFKSSRAAMSAVPRDLCELTEIIVQQQIKGAMVHWYTCTLPQGLQLSVPLFNGTGIPEELYFKTLTDEMEVKGVVPVLVTLAFYEECLLIAQSYFHKRLHGPETSWMMIHKYWKGGKLILDSTERKQAVGNKWERRIDKLLAVKPMVNFDGTDDEFFYMVMSIMFPPEGRTSILFIAVQSASSALRLLRFIQALPAYRCFFDLRVLTDIWTVLMRALRFEQFFNKDEEALLPYIRQGLEDCLRVAKAELSEPEHGIAAHIASMERELREHYEFSCSSSSNLFYA
ncbi:hypothetical protein BX666DRAFT_477523 [Dichotomocladium elegans]|nr:hypothetical protein BX666DRAFT_477523 [Dichotomocladium elegans]